MTQRRAIVACLSLMAAVGCGSPTSQKDAGPDAKLDAGGDVAAETGPDVAAETGPDVAPDAAADVTPDTAADKPDAQPDSGTDVADATDGGDAGASSANPDGDGGMSQTQLELVLLQTNDLHSYLEGHSPVLDYSPATTGDDTTKGGIARLAPRIGAARTAAGSTPVLLLDSGDFMMGTAFELLAASQAAELMELQNLHYDSVTLGNHEFDWTPGGLALALGAAATKGFAVP